MSSIPLGVLCWSEGAALKMMSLVGTLHRACPESYFKSEPRCDIIPRLAGRSNKAHTVFDISSSDVFSAGLRASGFTDHQGMPGAQLDELETRLTT
jgi:hypothetical protein